MTVSPLNPVLSRLPILVIMPIDTCNCRCRMCGCWKPGSNTRMTLEQVRSLAVEGEQLCLKQVVISGGEPLLHPQLARICRLFRKRAVKVTLLTNGMLLEQQAEDLAACCSEIIVSLDGPESVHNRIRRVPDAYQRLATGIAALRRFQPSLRITARCTVQKINAGQLGQTVAAARLLGLDQISFLAVSAGRNQFRQNDLAGSTADILPGLVDLHPLRIELESMRSLCHDAFSSGFIAESPEKLRRRILQYFEALHGLAAFSANRCNATGHSAVIEAGGDLRPCFFLPPVGNVFCDGGLAAVLNNLAAQGKRFALQAEPDEACIGCVCPLHYKPSVLTKPEKAGQAHRSRYLPE